MLIPSLRSTRRTTSSEPLRRLEKEAEKHGDMRDMNIDELDKLWSG